METLEKVAFLDCIKNDERDELRIWNFGLVSYSVKYYTKFVCSELY